MLESIPRRRVLQSAAAAITASSSARVWGANDAVRLGVIGCGARGEYVMKHFLKEGGVRVTALADVYGDRVEKCRQAAADASGYGDYRQLLERQDVDAVLIGTPDHWHAPAAIDAMNAGKDVYVEKPLTLRMEEGPEIVRAARANQRICQVGLQQRSGSIFLQAKEEFVDSGRLGKVRLARCVWPGSPPRPLSSPVSAKPANLDWDLYVKPVKYRDWNPHQYFHYRAFLDFGGGKLTDLFTHWVDVVHMFLGQDNPVAVSAAGGIYRDFQDGRTAPDSIHLLLEYPGGLTVTFESPAVRGAGEYGIEFCGEEGKLFINRNRYEFRSHERGAPPVLFRSPAEPTAEHVHNFIECMRSRRSPTADAFIGHRAVIPAHLGVMAYVEKRRIHFDPVLEKVLP